jgi:hypothetical protein
MANTRDNNGQEPEQLSLFVNATPPKPQKTPKKLRIEPTEAGPTNQDKFQMYSGMPPIVLPTRWENLKREIEGNKVSLRTIIRPIPQAMAVIRNIVEYLKTTRGCQVLIIRADTGSGKTTFLNTLPHYMQDVKFRIQTIELQQLNEDDFSKALWRIQTFTNEVNLIVLEGREKPESISDKYIQVVLANINRFARSKQVPLLFVIPTIEEEVARSWCEHGSKVGDLIPEQKLYEGSRWYNFPGVLKDKYIEVAEDTVRTLNPPYNLYEFGVSRDQAKNWVSTAPTIGKFIEILANRISSIRAATTVPLAGKREHVWIVYCAPDLRHYDHTYLVIDGLCQDEMLRVSPTKLIPPDTNTSFAKFWRQSPNWEKLVATIDFLDVRLINLPIITVVTAALTYGRDELLESFKNTKLKAYKEEILKKIPDATAEWDQPLAERRLQEKNARDSLGRSNLFLLLRGNPAEQQKGGNSESIKVLAQYLHLRLKASEGHLHYCLGCALKDLLEYNQIPGFSGDVETETPLVPNQTDPVPDISIHTDTDTYALEFHFFQKQFASSEVSRYAVKDVIAKYMRSLPHLNSILDTINNK